MNKIKRIVALALALAATCAAAGAAGGEGKAFGPSDVMRCGGQNIMVCRGADVYAALGAPQSRTHLGYEGATGHGFVDWAYPGLVIRLVAGYDSPYFEWETDLATLPFDEPFLKVRSVAVDRAGIIGPRDIQVGMPMDGVLALFPPPMQPGHPPYEHAFDGDVMLYAYGGAGIDDPYGTYSPYPPYGMICQGGGDDGYDYALLCNYIDPSFYEEEVLAHGGDPSSYVYHSQYRFSVFFAGGEATGFTLYYGATSE